MAEILHLLLKLGRREWITNSVFSFFQGKSNNIMKIYNQFYGYTWKPWTNKCFMWDVLHTYLSKLKLKRMIKCQRMNLKMICPLASIHEKLRKFAFRPRRLCSYLNLLLHWQYLKDIVIIIIFLNRINVTLFKFKISGV